MRLLDRYLLRELMVALGYCLSGFLVFWLAFDLFSNLDDFQEKNLRVWDVAEYYLVKLPELLLVVMPIALLLALLYALNNHSRHNELIAIRSAGVSLWRMITPYLAVGFLFSLLLFALNETWIADSGRRIERILNRRTQSETEQKGEGWRRNLTLYNSRDKRLWQISAYNVETREMANVHVEWLLPDGSRRRVFAKRAGRTNDHWVFYQVQQLTYPAEEQQMYTRSQTNRMVMTEFSETPLQIQSEIKISQLEDIEDAKDAHISIQEILNYLRINPDLRPAREAMIRTKLHDRFATPWTSLVVVLIATPFGAASGRRNVVVGVASSVFICFTYFVIKELSLALGTGGYLLPWLAAWLPNLCFAGIGLGLTYRVR